MKNLYFLFCLSTFLVFACQPEPKQTEEELEDQAEDFLRKQQVIDTTADAASNPYASDSTKNEMTEEEQNELSEKLTQVENDKAERDSLVIQQTKEALKKSIVKESIKCCNELEIDTDCCCKKALELYLKEKSYIMKDSIRNKDPIFSQFCMSEEWFKSEVEKIIEKENEEDDMDDFDR